ncbi:MAG: tRNA epoxyqueuosine(34) reductase QueG [Bacteroidetes bacterium]|nr:tRNA epoxyqueuosine(34) reductase QueG [Bacteroidota bacterium]
MNFSAQKNSQIVKKLAKDEGFDFCGISKAEFLDSEAKRLEYWLKNGFHGKMQWMENYFDKRLDPRLLVQGAKSVISLLYNYHTDKKQLNSDVPIVSKYAFGKDYHLTIKEKLYKLLEKINENIGKTDARVFTDSAPVMERVWAARGGLGWIGKHTLLINKSKGSFYFIAEIICDIELMPDAPIKDYCGTCTACIDACPTGAILPGKILDSNRCISYLTIELKDELPVEFKNKLENRVFGCDICQEVCPWNRFAESNKEADFQPQLEFLNMNKKDWENLNEETFNKLFKNSAIKRTKFKGLRRNIDFLEN